MPPTSPQVQTIRNTTQHHLDIEEISDDIVILKDGAGCLVMKATAINFSLLSEEEQEAIIYAYAAILNSLTYPIQILIQSERKDISDYLQHIKRHEDNQPDKVIKEQIRKYRRFVEETVQRNNVLDKKFHIVIPFTAIELGAPTAFMSQLKNEKKLPFPMSYIIEQAKNHLHPKRDHLIRQFTRLGIRLTQLTTPELIELFYRAYNPDYSYGQQLATGNNYSAPVVEGPPELGRNVNQFLRNQPNQDRFEPLNNPGATTASPDMGTPPAAEIPGFNINPPTNSQPNQASQQPQALVTNNQ